MLSAVILLSTAVAQVQIPGNPKPCSFPSEFETRISSYNFQLGEHDQMLAAVDTRNKRIFTQDVVTGRTPGRKYYEHITLYDANPPMRYSIDMSTRVCNRTEIPAKDKFQSFGVPSNASFTSTYDIGSYNEGFTANEFTLYKKAEPEPGKPTVYYYQTVVTAHTCVPVTETLLHQDANGNINQELSFMRSFSDVVLGIANPEFFTPPSICFTPPPPPPPAPPAPPTPCVRELVALCGTSKTPSAKCIACADTNQAVLTKAGCTYTDIDHFCVPKYFKSNGLGF